MVAPCVAEYFALAQTVHATLPLLVLYLPATHPEHGPPFAPVYPALQTQAAAAELWLGEVELSGQPTQISTAVAPTVTEYVPAPQSVHAALPALVLYLPATHSAHEPTGPVLPAGQSNVHAAKAVLPAAETPPAPQDVHALAPVAPVAPDHVPATQSTHAALPVTILYLPATHAEHVPPFAPVKPALQVQAVITVLELGAFALEGQAKHVDEALAPTAAEYVADPQSVHTALPLLVLYLPATHVEQTPPSGPEDPALHVQIVLDAAEFEFARQTRHAEDAVAPTVCKYVPVPQSVHASLPALVLYFPATHNAHVPGSPVLPAGQGGVVQTLAPAVDVEPAAHVLHADALGMLVYLPAEQDEHAPGTTNGTTSANERYPPYWYMYKYRPLTTWSQFTVTHVISQTYVPGFWTSDLQILFSGEFQARPSPIAKYQLLES